MTLGLVYHMPFWRAADGTLREVEGSFARYVDSLAPYFDEIVLCVPEVASASGEGTAIRSSNVRLASLPHFDGPAQFYPKLALTLMPIARFVRSIDVLHCRVPTPAAAFAFAFARLFRRPAFLLVVGDLRAILPTTSYRGLKRLLWRAYTAFEERNIQWMAEHALTFANGPALAAKHARPAHPVIETRTTTIAESDVATRPDTCGGAPARILTVSRIDPRKGLRVLPGVVRALIDAGHRVSLDIVGPTVGAPGEIEQRAIEEDAMRLGVAGELRFRGAVPLDRLLELYREYDLFVLPTLPGEGIPRVLLEAMTAGLPVVTTRVAGIPGLVVDEVNGLLVDQPTVGAIVTTVRRVLSDGPLRRGLIANGYRTARAHTLQAQAAQMMCTVSERLGVSLRPALATPAG